MKTTQKNLFLLLIVFFYSCKQNSDTSESKLIEKINAVHEQIMIQGNISEKERLALLGLASLVGQREDLSSNEDLRDVIPLDEVESAPIHPDCEKLSTESLKQCFLESVDTFIKFQLNPNIAKKLAITAPQEVEVFFKIGKDGKVTNLKVRKANVAIQAEIIRVLKQLPVMKPASQNGELVEVMCSTVVSYGG